MTTSTNNYYTAEVRADKGRCAIATKRIASGTRVLLADAFAWVSVSSCNWCLKESSATRRCGCCKRVKYCSRACQQLDWQKGNHAKECDAFRQIPASVRGEAVQTVLLVTRLAAKLYMQSTKAGGSGDHEQHGEEVLKLRHHYEDHAEQKLFQYREMAQLVLLLLSRSKFNSSAVAPQKKSFEELSERLLEKIVLLFCRVNCNAFTISNDVCAPLGIGVFPNGALYNHSCAPNCIVSFKNQQMVVHTIDNVPQGEELTISYVELLESTTARRQALKESYFFDCQCRRCTNALAGECNDDWYLDGYACCPEGVATSFEGETAVSTVQCHKCGSERTVSNLSELKQECEEIELKLQQQQTLTASVKWRLHQQLQTILEGKLGLHPRNTRIATFWRQVGTFLLEASGSEFPDGKKPASAVEYFTKELHATEWVLPTMKLPSRGLLHFQLGKLYCEEAVSDNISHSRHVEAREKAIKHFQQALSM